MIFHMKKMRAGEIDDMVACTAGPNQKEKQLINDFGIEAYCIKPLKKESVLPLLNTFL